MMLDVKMFGALKLSIQNQALELPKSKKTRALFAFLTLHSRPVSRAQLGDLLWEGAEDCRAALRWSLSQLRPLINQQGLTILNADRQAVAVDHDLINADLLNIKTKLAGSTLSARQLKQLVNHLNEPFLSDLDIPDQKQYQSWLVSERVGITKLTSLACARLARNTELSLLERQGWANKWLKYSPYDTDAATLTMDLLVKLGGEQKHQELAKTLSNRFKNAGICWRYQIEQTPTLKPVTVKTSFNPALMAGHQTIQYSASNDSVKIAYAVTGQGKTTLVKTANWLNHLELDWEAPIWSPLLRNLAVDHRLIRYDERGNGMSDWEVDDLSYEKFVEDLELIVSNTTENQFALLGISQGASVAIDYAVRHPERVSHLILFGGYAAGWRINADEETIKEREAVMTLVAQGWGRDNPSYRQMFTSSFMPSATFEELGWFNEFQRLTTSAKNAVKFLEVFSTIDVRHLLEKITVPTLVMHSKYDQRIPYSVGQALAMNIPNSEFLTLESDSHLLLGREPAAKIFTEAIRKFIKNN